MGEFDQLAEERLVTQGLNESDVTSPTNGEFEFPGLDPRQSDIDIISAPENDRLEFETPQGIRPTISAKQLFGEFDEEEEITVGHGVPHHANPAPVPKQNVKSQAPDADESLGTCKPRPTESEAKDQVPPAICADTTIESSAKLKFVNLASMDDQGAEISSIEAAYYGTSPCGCGFTKSEMELEEALHQEIIGMGQVTDSALTKLTDGSTDQTDDSLEGPEHHSIQNWADTPPDQLVDLKPASEGDADDLVNDYVVVTGHGELPIQPSASNSMDIEAIPTLRVTEPGPQEQPEFSDDAKLCSTTNAPFVRDDSDLLIIEDELNLRHVDAANRRDPKDKTISVDFQSMLSRMRSGTK